jgi:hypothetical protein
VGRIRDARVYAQPLDQATVAALQPGKPVEQVEPWAWWDFATTGIYDRAGRFNQIRLSGGAKLEGGCLVLGGTRPTMLATRDGESCDTAQVPATWSRTGPVPAAVVQSTRLFREKLLNDPYRPRYHFCVPEDNGWPGDSNTYFAPEALIDGQGRQIMWAWLTDNPGGEEARGWSGVYGLPRSLWLGDDGTLRMAPVEELKMLRCGERTWSDIALSDGGTKPVEGVVGDSCELEIAIDPGAARQCGVKVRRSPGGEESTSLYYDAQAK